MKTTVYLVRHSEPFKMHMGLEKTSDSVFLINMKNPLSINGEKLADSISDNEEFKKLDVVWSSNYVRAMSTAKYFAYKNNLKVNIDERLGERKQGIKSWNDLPKDFISHQFLDENYKIGDGESQKETRKRMLLALNDIINENKGKRILVVSHSAAISFLLGNWCEINCQGNYKFNNVTFFDGLWDYCEAFKLEFDDNNNLINVKNLCYN